MHSIKKDVVCEIALHCWISIWTQIAAFCIPDQQDAHIKGPKTGICDKGYILKYAKSAKLTWQGEKTGICDKG